MPMIALAAMTVMQAQPAPSSTWQSGLVDDSCGVVRTYSNDAGPVLIEITRPIIEPQRLRVVLPKAIDPGKRDEQLEVTMRPEGVSFRANDVLMVAIGRGRPTKRPDPRAIVETTDGRVVRRVEDKIVEPMAKAQTLEIKVGTRTPIVLETAGASGAIAALNTCFKTKITAVGLSESDFSSPHTPAEGIDPARWVTQDDYPKEALSRKEEGAVQIIYFIETNGRVRDCRAISNAPAVLNNATCDLIRQRARYKPARDAAGIPVRSLAKRTTIWNLP